MKIRLHLIDLFEWFQEHLLLLVILLLVVIFLSMPMINFPIGEPQYLNGVVVNVEGATQAVEYNTYSPRGLLLGYATVTLKNGIDLHLIIDRTPIPMKGNKIKIAKFKNIFYGASYFYEGVIENEN